MKQKLPIILMLAALFALSTWPTPAPAQTALGNPAQLVATNLATGAVSTNNAVIGTGRASNVAVQLVLNGLGAGATNSASVLVQQSVDAVNWLSYATVDLVGGGATTVSCLSNFTINARSVRVRTITSTANGTGTNLNVEVWTRTKDGL